MGERVNEVDTAEEDIDDADDPIHVTELKKN